MPSKIAKGLPSEVAASAGAGHTIQDEGVSLPQQAILDFVGEAITVTDDVSNDKTIVNVTSPTLGTAAALDVGTSADNVLQLDGTGKLPAVDGSQLTNLPTAGERIELSANVTWYVATDGDPTADGLTVNTAINPETAFKQIPTVVFNGFILTLKLAAGTYNSNYDSYYTYGLRIPEGGIVILSGETWTTDPTTIVNYLEASNSSGFFLIIENVKFTDSFISFNSTNEVLIRDCCYEPMQPTWSCMFLSDSCRVRLSGTIQFNSDFFALAQLARGTKLDLENCVFKDAGTSKTFNTFIDLKTNSVTFIDAPTISGTFTGKKFNINKGGGYIAGNVSLLPGDTPGTYGKSIFYDDVVLGTASTLDVGTSANQIVQLDANARLPAVDGSQLTNLSTSDAAANITVDTTNFNLNLSGTDTTVQAALETLDDLVAGSVGGSGLTYSYQNTSFTADPHTLYGVDTSTVTVTATLPAAPVDGDRISFCDAAGTFGTNNLTIARNGKNIGEWADDLILTQDYESATVVFDATLDRWVLAESATPNSVTTIPFGGFIEVVNDKTYPLFQATDPYVIRSFRVKTSSGTCTISIEVDGVAVSELSTLAVSSTDQLINLSTLSLIPSNGRLAMIVSDNNSAVDLEFTIMLGVT